MSKVIFFMSTSLDGYIEGPNREIDWHHVDDEFNEVAIRQLTEADTLLFGRVTYELMAGFWPTKEAIETDPIVAGLMNSKSKIVFSKSLIKADWQNTRLVKTDFITELNRLKKKPGEGLFMLGGSDLAVSCLQAGLLDEIRIMLNPIVLGAGKPLFKGIQNRLNLKLLKTRVFKNGNVLLSYRPVYQTEGA
ncbi:MAG: dihydrofolate reductase family protein [Anaerolineaceae bacterium]